MKTAWYKNDEKTLRLDIDEWSIDEPRRQMGTNSVGLGIMKTDAGKYEVFLFNGAFGGSDPVIDTMDTLDDARRLANIFMNNVSTWNKLKEYFVKCGIADLWNSLYR